MKYTGFAVRNFKGIESAEIKLGATRIVSVVGLNESGKTTLLEAIHSFRPDKSTQTLVHGDEVKPIDPELLIPKHLESNFNDEICVSATVHLSERDKHLLATHMLSEHALELDTMLLPTAFDITNRHSFKASKFKGTNSTWDIEFYRKGKGAKAQREVEGDGTLWQAATDWIQDRLPVISYFPTLLFAFPEYIDLTDTDPDSRNQIYRRMFEGVLKHVDMSLDIDEHIVSRMRGKGGTFVEVFSRYANSLDQRNVEALMRKLESLLTSVVIKRWNDIFEDKLLSKEVVLEPSLSKDPGKDEAVVGVKFLIKDGTDTYNVSERSLGFRWFFCFLLFTQFQRAQRGKRPTIFIFDEPASNLHARAQRQLLESFTHIAKGSDALIYSTHSHHMVNPAWLEGTYVVENLGITYGGSDYSTTWKNTKTQVQAHPYRQFVGRFPEKQNYFQPILEALDYAPSDLEFVDPAVLVEGKSDFYVCTYFARVLGLTKCQFMPSSGAGDLGPLVALYLGWGKKFVLCLDGDKKGTASKISYAEEFCLPDNRCMCLADVDPDFRNIEAVLGDEVNAMVAAHFGVTGRANKKQVMRFFQEHLAVEKVLALPESVVDRFKRLFAEFESRLAD